MKRVHEDWYQGTADAVFQNFQSIEAEAPEQTLILSGDHIYKMNYRRDAGLAPRSTARISPSPPSRCRRRRPAASASPRSTRTTASWASRKSRSTATPSARAFDPSMVSASMGIYVFKTEVLLRALHEDAAATPTRATISART